MLPPLLTSIRSTPADLEHPRYLHHLTEVDAPFGVVGRRNTHEQWPVAPDLAHGRNEFAQAAQPACQVAAIAVAALVGERGEELVEQVAVRRVQLDHVETRGQGAPGSGYELALHLVNFRLAQLVRGRPTLFEGQGAGRYRWLGADAVLPAPGLAPGVR